MPVKSHQEKRNFVSQVKRAKDKTKRTLLARFLSVAHKAAFPDFISPMLCTPTPSPMDDPRFLHEVKYDGYRILSYVRSAKVYLKTRKNQNYTSKYPLVVEALQKLDVNAVLDGELVVFNEDGRPTFNAIQTYNGQRTPITYCIFDILWLDGHDLTDLPLETRKSILAAILSKNEILRYTESYDDGPGLYQNMLRRGWEGIVSKERDSPYIPSVHNRRTDK